MRNKTSRNKEKTFIGYYRLKVLYGYSIEESISVQIPTNARCNFDCDTDYWVTVFSISIHNVSHLSIECSLNKKWENVVI